MEIDWDLILKAILILAVSGSIVMVSFQVFKLLGEVRLLVKDSRKIVDDISKISDGVSRGYDSISGLLSFTNPGSGIGKRLVDLGIASGVSALAKRYFNSKRSSGENSDL